MLVLDTETPTLFGTFVVAKDFFVSIRYTFFCACWIALAIQRTPAGAFSAECEILAIQFIWWACVWGLNR